ncbi:hypothetical protein CGH36_23805, partial [Vibrio parahaemolyticus]
ANGFRIRDYLAELKVHVEEINGLAVKALKKKLVLNQYDDVCKIIERWDSILSYHLDGIGYLRIPPEKSLKPVSLSKKENKKILIGKVIRSGKMEKTVTVQIDRFKKHNPTGKMI